jgi:hypothetical protein
MFDLFRLVRESCAGACRDARFVRIETAAIPGLARRIAPLIPAELRHTPEHHLIGQGDATIAYFLFLDTLNFGSGYFDHWAPFEGHSDYYAVAAALKRWFETEGPPPPAALERVGARDLAAIFGQDITQPEVCSLLDLFATALHELTAFTRGQLGSKYENILRAGDHDAGRIVRLLLHMPMYQDWRRTKGGWIFFLKRAQILVQDIAIAANEGDIAPIAGADMLTAFADNMLPYVLATEGVLRYETALARRVMAGRLIAPGSREELELRAHAVHVVELLTHELNAQSHRTTARAVDLALWNLGLALQGRTPLKPHRTLTHFY